MKDKFSIFSPPAARSDPLEQGINFKKSPNKFAVYEPPTKTKDYHKLTPNHSFSATNLDNMKKIPSQYSALRQTLNFKPSSFEAWMQDDEKEKLQKPNSILRQTLDSRTLFKPKLQKSSSEVEYLSNSMWQKPSTQTDLSYSRRTNYVPETKSLRHIDNEESQHSITELKEKWKSGAFRIQNKKDKHPDNLDYLNKLTTSRAKIEDEVKKKHNIERKYSQKMEPAKEVEQTRVFRKKQNPHEHTECYTPKVPKISYDERFKKVGSPTSTNNSDSRSPPNRFIDFEREFKKPIPMMSVDDFQTVKTLGEGKFGVVTMVKHKRTKTVYALKKIPKEMIKSHYMVDQLALEIKLQSYLNHKNILGIYNFFDNSTHLFILLEYMDQGTLYSQLKKNKILTEVSAASIIKQITEAVQYLHDQDIAHRDIKPQNIVISNNVYKLCDFGWATVCNERRKTYCGTFDYAAPQILQGKDYDWSVDLWCLGVLTFELLTGKAPFYHLSRKETMRKIINCEMENIAYPDTMSPEAIDFIEQLIQKTPQKRMKASQALKHKFLQQAEE